MKSGDSESLPASIYCDIALQEPLAHTVVDLRHLLAKYYRCELS